MHVLHFVHRTPPEYSGAAKQALALSRELSHRGVTSILVGYTVTRTSELTRQQGVSVQSIRLRRGLMGKFVQYAELAYALLRSRSDVVHVHGFYLPVILVALFLHRPVVLKTTLHGVDDLATLASKGVMVRLVLRHVTRVISVSDQLHSANSAVAQSELVPNGVELEAFSPDKHGAARAKVSREFGVEPSKILFLFNGGDSERKGFNDLVYIWKKIQASIGRNKVHLIVTGRFESQGNLRSLVAQLDESATIIPGVVDNMGTLMAAADVFVFLSTREGLPNSVLEAVVSGTLVFARDIPGVYNGVLSHGENSVLFVNFNMDSIRALQSALKKGIPLPESIAGLRRKFDLGGIAHKYVRLYGDITRRSLAGDLSNE